MKKMSWVGWALPLIAASFAPVALAADHADGPAASADPAADITDIYAWVDSSKGKTYLVMDLGKDQPTSAKFSDAVKYVFHTSSMASYGATTKKSQDIICTFNTAQTIQCWVGTSEYMTGDASKTAGLASKDGKMTVFAGVRDDPFFFNLTGFKDVVTIVEGAAKSLKFDHEGCPLLDKPTSQLLVNTLKESADGGTAKNDFAKFNVLSIVLELDTTLVNAGGPILGVWASTNK